MARCRADDPLFDPLLERSSIAIPPDYLPSAPGILFAGRRMLCYAGCVSGKRCPPDWIKREPGVYLKSLGNYIFRVRQSGDWGTRRWAVERIHWLSEELEALVFPFQYVPIWGRTRREAIFLAEYYQSDQALKLVGCCWKQPYLQ